MWDHWGTDTTLYVFAALLFIVGIVLAIAVVVNRCPEEERNNSIRAQLLLLGAVALSLLAIYSQRHNMVEHVKHLMQ